MRAPDAKKQKLETAARRPVPIASCSAESVAVKPNCPVIADSMLAENFVGMLGGFRLTHTACPVDQRQLVDVDVQRGDGGAGMGVRSRRLQQLPLRAHRDILARAHGQRAGEQAGGTGDEHSVVRHSAGADPQHQRKIADQPVVGAEHRGAKTPGEACAAPRSQRPNHLAMDPLVSGHGGRGIDIGVVGGPRLSALGQGEHKDRSEMPRQEPQDARTYIAAPGLSHIVTEQGQPVLLVAGLRGGQRQQDLALLAGASTGQVPVHGGFGPLVRQVLTPTPKIGGGRCRPAGLAGRRGCTNP